MKHKIITIKSTQLMPQAKIFPEQLEHNEEQYSMYDMAHPSLAFWSYAFRSSKGTLLITHKHLLTDCHYLRDLLINSEMEEDND